MASLFKSIAFTSVVWASKVMPRFLQRAEISWEALPGGLHVHQASCRVWGFATFVWQVAKVLRFHLNSMGRLHLCGCLLWVRGLHFLHRQVWLKFLQKGLGLLKLCGNTTCSTTFTQGWGSTSPVQRFVCAWSCLTLQLMGHSTTSLRISRCTASSTKRVPTTKSWQKLCWVLSRASKTVLMEDGAKAISHVWFANGLATTVPDMLLEPLRTHCISNVLLCLHCYQLLFSSFFFLVGKRSSFFVETLGVICGGVCLPNCFRPSRLMRPLLSTRAWAACIAKGFGSNLKRGRSWLRMGWIFWSSTGS